MTRHHVRSRHCAFLAALAIGCVLLVIPPDSAQATPRPRLYINASGHSIPTIFLGLRLDARFAKVLAGQVASLRRESVPHFQDLVSRGTCPKSLLRNAAFLQGSSCYGQYMMPNSYECPYSCNVFEVWYEFSSTGTQQCQGYTFAGDACAGCELYEQTCDPCS
jgi:hypothetical protein